MTSNREQLECRSLADKPLMQSSDQSSINIPIQGGQHVTRGQLSQCRYDPAEKCWRGPITSSKQDTLRLTRIMKKNHQQQEKQKQSSLMTNKKKITTKKLDISDSEEEEIYDTTQDSWEDDEIVVDKDIKTPFSSHEEAHCAVWTTPRKDILEDKQKIFNWDRPAGDTGSASFTSSSQEVVRLQHDVKKKDHALEILRKHLLQSQTENFQLVQKLDSCSGKDYHELQKENARLRQQLQRQFRENVRLTSNQRRESNHLLHREDLDRMKKSQ